MKRIVIRRSTNEGLAYVLNGIPPAKIDEVAVSLNTLFATQDIRTYYQSERTGKEAWTTLVAKVEKD